MNKSKVYFMRIKENTSVFIFVKDFLDKIDILRYIKGNKLFLKINLISSEFVPGQCTSPIVLDAILSYLVESNRKFDITVGDTDLAATCQCDKAAKVWGVLKIVKKYDVKFQNLAKDKLVEVNLNGEVLKKTFLPKVILETDSIISVPIIKTHCLTKMTCALKNMWGLLPRIRHQYHLIADQVISDINMFIKEKLAFIVVDGTISMEGNGPRTGIPRVTNVLFGSNDPVAVDAAVARFMGLGLPEHILNAYKRGIGNLEYEIIGNNFYSENFIPPDPDKQPIFKYEMMFRKSSLKPLFFNTFIFNILAWMATKYNTFWYYRLKGKRYREKILNEIWYKEELLKYIEDK